LGLPGTNALAYFGPFVSNEEKNVCEYCHKYFIPFSSCCYNCIGA